VSVLTVLAATTPATTGSSGQSKPWVLIVFGVIIALFGLVQATNPHLIWRMNRWQYKNPDANEPSGSAFKVMRVVGAIAFVVGIVVIVIGITK
jgi:hypothetical protein